MIERRAVFAKPSCRWCWDLGWVEELVSQLPELQFSRADGTIPDPVPRPPKVEVVPCTWCEAGSAYRATRARALADIIERQHADVSRLDDPRRAEAAALMRIVEACLATE